MLNIFGWIRTQARQAMLAGIADAVTDIANSAAADADLRLQRLLNGKGAVDVVPEPLPAPEPDASGNGHDRKKARAKA